MESLGSLAVLVAVVEAGGFAAAARRLNLSKSAVSKQVSRLEAHLGARLLHRTTRKLSLTEAGEAYFRHAQQALEAARAAEDAVTGARGQPRGTLRVAVPMTYGLLKILPALTGFLAAYPELKLELQMEDRLTDLVEGGYDLAIRIGNLGNSTLVARRLASSEIVICAAPGYLAARGEPDTPAALASHDCLSFSYFPGGNEWRFQGPRGPVAVEINSRLTVSNSLALREAAVAGLGIVRAPLFAVDTALAAGELRRILPDYRMATVGIHAVFPEGRHVPAKSRVFVEYLAQRLAGGR